LWKRYGPLWARLVADVGADVALAPAGVAGADDPRLSQIPGLAFRLAAAQALALADCDTLIVPELNPEGAATRGGAQDPWVASFPEVLHRSVPGLPPLIAVPAGYDERLEGLIVETLLRLSGDATAVRRAWQRRRSSVRPTAPRRLYIAPAPPGVRTTALLCQPWLASDALAAAVTTPGHRVLAADAFDPVALRSEGDLVEAGLIDTDREVLGAARLFGRSAAVDELLLVVDEGSGADAWLARRLEGAAHKPFRTLALSELPDPERLIAVPDGG
jgi:hypothetical protein